ncbi:MAG: hypothetical protein EBS92_03950 [Proteobacteria bacterium]|nr:hypothetical protein [Pseudomonadota bacterium]
MKPYTNISHLLWNFFCILNAKNFFSHYIKKLTSSLLQNTRFCMFLGHKIDFKKNDSYFQEYHYQRKRKKTARIFLIEYG